MKRLKQWWWEQRAWTEIIDEIFNAWLACIAVMLVVGVGGLPIWVMLYVTSWLVWR